MHQYQPQSPQPQRNLIDSPEAYEVLDVVLAQVTITVVSLQLIGMYSSKYSGDLKSDHLKSGNI